MKTILRHRGYTLLELIVAVGVFSIVMLAATSAYLSLISLDRNARATTDVVTNLSFAVDSMTREIRTGTDYKCNNSSGTPNCGFSQYGTNPGSSFGFMDSRPTPRSIVYSVSSDNQLVVSINGATPIALTDSRIRVENLEFYVRGVGLGGEAAVQPQVMFVLSGVLEVSPGKELSFSIQSMASQRFLEISS